MIKLIENERCLGDRLTVRFIKNNKIDINYSNYYNKENDFIEMKK